MFYAIAAAGYDNTIKWDMSMQPWHLLILQIWPLENSWRLGSHEFDAPERSWVTVALSRQGCQTCTRGHCSD